MKNLKTLLLIIIFLAYGGLSYGQVVTIKATSDSILCFGQPLTLSVDTSGFPLNAMLTYAWTTPNGPSTAYPYMHNSPLAGNYSVEVFGGTIPVNDNIPIIVNQIPPAMIIPPTTKELTCSTTEIQLTATGGGVGGIYKWSNDVIGSTITIQQQGTYIVTVTANSGCSDTASIVITQDINTTTAVINPPSTKELTCSTTQIQLTATGGGVGGIYKWSNGVIGSTITIEQQGTYIVTVTATNGCSDTASIVITQNINPPTATINPPSTKELTCSTTQIQVTATGGGVYKWSNGVIGSTITIQQQGTYIVTVTATNGCIDTASIVISQDIVPPTATINPPSSFVLTCSITSISVTTMGGGNGGTYLWSGELGDNANATITAAGTYSVTVTGSNGCIDTDDIVITKAIELLIEKESITPVSCNGGNDGSATINVTAGESDFFYKWSNGGNSKTVENLIEGVYTVTVTDRYGCEEEDTFTIDQPLPLTFNLDEEASFCPNSTVTVEVTTVEGGNSGYEYKWSGGSNIKEFKNVFSEIGKYTVRVTDAKMCESIDSIQIKQHIIKIPEIKNITTLPGYIIENSIEFSNCENKNLEIKLGFNNVFAQGARYVWYHDNSSSIDSTISQEKLDITYGDKGFKVILKGTQAGNNCPTSDSILFIKKPINAPLILNESYTAACNVIILDKRYEIEPLDNNIIKFSESVYYFTGDSSQVKYYFTGDDGQRCQFSTFIINPSNSHLPVSNDLLVLDQCGPFLLAEHKKGYCYNWYKTDNNETVLLTTSDSSWLKIDNADDAAKYKAIGYPCDNNCSDTVLISTRSEDISNDINCGSKDKGGSLSTYPNPSSGQMYIRLKGVPDGICTFTINDLYGRIVHSFKADYDGHDISTDLTQLNSGIYIIHVSSASERLTSKIEIIK